MTMCHQTKLNTQCYLGWFPLPLQLLCHSIKRFNKNGNTCSTFHPVRFYLIMDLNIMHNLGGLIIGRVW